MIKKPLLLSELEQYNVIDKVIIESLEQALYRLVVEMAGQQYYVVEPSGRSLTRRSIVDIQAVLIPFHVKAMYLYHQSPYDEMIGHDVNKNSNALFVPIGQYFTSDDKVLH